MGDICEFCNQGDNYCQNVCEVNKRYQQEQKSKGEKKMVNACGEKDCKSFNENLGDGCPCNDCIKLGGKVDHYQKAEKLYRIRAADCTGASDIWESEGTGPLEKMKARAQEIAKTWTGNFSGAVMEVLDEDGQVVASYPRKIVR